MVEAGARLLTIRAATPADAGALTEMIRALAAHQDQLVHVAFTEEQLAAALAGNPPAAHALIAEDADGPVGFVTYTVPYSIWRGARYLMVDDVFVHARARGQGIGERLMRRLARIGLEQGMPARWEVLVENVRAQRFYRRLGAELDDKIICRWRPDAMRAVAAEA